MRIAVDLSPAVSLRSGIGRYAHELTAALQTLDRSNEYVAFYLGPPDAQLAPSLQHLARRNLAIAEKPWRLSVLLAYFAHISQDRFLPGVDLFHATGNVLPRFSRIARVFTLHDLTFRLLPETHKPLNRWFLQIMVPHFLKAADIVIADSVCTRRDALRLYRVDEAKVRVIYPGVGGQFQPATPPAVEAVRRKYGLPGRFILTVGNLEPRKNLVALLEAYSALLQTGGRTDDLPKLVLVGGRSWLAEPLFRRLRDLRLADRVVLTGFVPDDDLAPLYSAAELFVYPSLYEGFGLPVAEAMACGTPVVASETSSLPEVAGDASILVDPRDVASLSRAIRAVLMDPERQRAMRSNGLKQASGFSWERAARETLAVYQSALGERAP
jgi:glycosyltransferase involved in cell wall biosynthesis